MLLLFPMTDPTMKVTPPMTPNSLFRETVADACPPPPPPPFSMPPIGATWMGVT